MARFDTAHEWIDIRLRSTCHQLVALTELSLDVEFLEGEELRTEISAKFRRSKIEAELGAAGLDLAHWWTDSRGDFSLSLAFPA